MNERPLGVTIICFLGLLDAIGSLVMGVFAIASSGFVGSIVLWVGEKYILDGIMLIIAGILKSTIAFGLLFLKKWAWTLTMVLDGISIIWLFTKGISIASILVALIPIMVLVYLYLKKSSFVDCAQL